MQVRSLRGVCIGVDRHLKPGDSADLDAATVQFLVSIGAVERVADAPPPADEPKPTNIPPVSTGKKEK